MPFSFFPCAFARETEGEFDYTPEALLIKEFLEACISINTDPQAPREGSKMV